jgi:hypothetical protein
MRSTRLVPNPVAVLLCAALVAILGAAGATPALAQDTATTGNAPLWFQFNVGHVGEDENSHVSVTLQKQAACAGGFHVFTSGPWGFWDTPAQEDWMGTATDIGYDQYMWAGELVPGAYYVRLGYGARPGCVLGVSGQAVDYVGLVNLGWHLAESEKPAAAPEPIVMAKPAIAGADFRLVTKQPADTTPELIAAAPVAVSAIPAPVEPDFVAAQPVAIAHSSHNPHEMAMVPNEWMPVTNNEPSMFTFYVGHVSDEQCSHVSVTLYGAPFRAGHFQIFTAEGVPFDAPEQDAWIGQAIMENGENPTWTGDLVPGAYYVRVYPEGMKNCLLAVSGAAVTY